MLLIECCSTFYNLMPDQHVAFVALISMKKKTKKNNSDRRFLSIPVSDHVAYTLGFSRHAYLHMCMIFLHLITHLETQKKIKSGGG